MEVFDPTLQKNMEQKVSERNTAAAELLLATYAMVDACIKRCFTDKADAVLTWREVAVLYAGLCTQDTEAIYEWLQGRLRVLQAEQSDPSAIPVEVAYLEPSHGYADTPVFAVRAM